jgi:hypothetical protein
MKMKTIAAVVLAYVACTMSAAAQQGEGHREHREHQVIIRGGHPGGIEPAQVDADHDGWVTRAEANAEATRIFAELDSNHDNRLDAADHGPGDDVLFDRRVGPPGAPPRIERNVTIIRRDSDGADLPEPPLPPEPPAPPGPPMFLMLLANHEEADRNGDGALSRDEFVTQQMRFFDAGDGNGDGRIRFEMPDMPEPPLPPEPPAPPAPPPR